VRARAAGLALLSALLVLAAALLAAGEVPDAPWVAGLYDGGDGDGAGAVLLLWDHAPDVVLPVPAPSGTVTPALAGLPPSRSLAPASDPRAPPPA
jgi:hypothetical protein